MEMSNNLKKIQNDIENADFEKLKGIAKGLLEACAYLEKANAGNIIELNEAKLVIEYYRHKEKEGFYNDNENEITLTEEQQENLINVLKILSEDDENEEEKEVN